MFCRICGRKLPDNASFCIYCGQKTVQITPRQTDEPPVPEDTYVPEETFIPEEAYIPEESEPFYEEESFADEPYMDEQYSDEPYSDEPYADEPYEEEYREPVYNRTQNRRQPVNQSVSGSRTGIRKGALILIVCIIAAAAVAGVFLFKHFRSGDSRTAGNTEADGTPGEQTADSPKALVDKWLSGNIDDLAGVRSLQGRTAEDEAHIREMEELYGSFFEDDTESGAEDAPVLKALLSCTDISLKTGFGMKYPSEVEMTVTGPDAAAVMETLHFRDYDDPDALLAAMKGELAAGRYEKRTVTVTVTLNKAEDGEVYADRSEEAVRALYGGLIELDEQEMLALYEQLYEEVKGE